MVSASHAERIPLMQALSDHGLVVVECSPDVAAIDALACCLVVVDDLDLLALIAEAEPQRRRIALIPRDLPRSRALAACAHDVVRCGAPPETWVDRIEAQLDHWRAQQTLHLGPLTIVRATPLPALWREDMPMALPPKAALILRHLLEAGDFVTTEALRRHVWYGEVASDLAVRKAVQALRRVAPELGVEHRTGHGYRIVLPPEAFDP